METLHPIKRDDTKPSNQIKCYIRDNTKPSNQIECYILDSVDSSSFPSSLSGGAAFSNNDST